VTSSTILDDIQSSLVYRRSPIDCAALSANAETMARPEIAGMFASNGICASTTGSQLGYLTSTANSVASATNMRYFSNWYGVMSLYSSLNDGYIFFDVDAPASTFLEGGYASSGSGNLVDIGGTPSCRLTPNVGTCGVAIDLTAFVPCTSITNTTWPMCQKPPARNIYPSYSASDPTVLSGTFPYPVGLYKMGSPAEDATAVQTLLDAPISYWRTDIEYNEFAFMVHYCDFYYGTTTYPNGRPVFCANDPLSYSDRVSFCADFLPQYMFTGLVLTTLSFEDLCPFLNENIPNRGAYPYCLVFSDHSK
jgi:hypothetical protein